MIATGLTLTLHVVNGMKLGFLSARLVGAASTAGVAVGSPAAGRFVDRHGLRPVLAVTTAAQLAFWLSAAFLPYWPLVAATFVAGVLALPVFSVIRQCVAAAVPAEQRRTGFTLDSMLVEISYMIGPAVAVSATAAFGSGRTMALVGLGLVGSGVALLVLNPPTRTGEERERAEAAVPRRQWLTPALLALLGVTLAATFVLAAAELSVVAVLKADSATRWTGLVIGLIIDDWGTRWSFAMAGLGGLLMVALAVPFWRHRRQHRPQAALTTPRCRVRHGGARRRVPALILAADLIRRYAYAIGDDNPLYTDPAYGERSWLGSQIAPPTILIHVRFPWAAGTGHLPSFRDLLLDRPR